MGSVNTHKVTGVSSSFSSRLRLFPLILKTPVFWCLINSRHLWPKNDTLLGSILLKYVFQSSHIKITTEDAFTYHSNASQKNYIMFIQASKSYSGVSIFPFILMITYSPPYSPTQDCTIDHRLWSLLGVKQIIIYTWFKEDKSHKLTR